MESGQKLGEGTIDTTMKVKAAARWRLNRIRFAGDKTNEAAVPMMSRKRLSPDNQGSSDQNE